MSTEHRIAVVTGATSGIGLALAERLLSDDAEVYAIGRDQPRLESLAARFGPAFHPVHTDLADPAATQACLTRLVDEVPRVDLVVNNAAHCVYAPPAQLEADRWRQLLETNLVAATTVVRGLMSRLRRGSHIVNVSSATARHLPDPAYGPYALTKAALDHYTHALRLELSPMGVKVSLIAPGLVDTPLYSKIEGYASQRTRLAERIPVWLSPQDVAECIVWLTAQPSHVLVSEVVLLPTGQVR